MVTLQNSVSVELKGDVEDSGPWFDVSFPPNDNTFLDELKRAQNHDLWVRGMFFVKDLSLHPLVCLDEFIRGHRVATWLKEVAPDAKVKARNNSVLGMIYAVKSGIGIGKLPTAIADNEPGLVRLKSGGS